MTCNFILKNGKRCSNDKLEESDFCHLENHYIDIELYNNVKQLRLEKFMIDRENSFDYFLREVEGDGACLFRCLSNAIFIHSGKDLRILIEKFEKTGYFKMDNFLKDYIDLADCFTAPDYLLDNDIEEQIARGLQKLILEYVKKNAKIKFMMDMTLEELITLCHEINLETYMKNYAIFAGEKNFIVETVEKKGKTSFKKVNIDSRWGGIPEIKIFCILFNFNIEIYVPEYFDRKLLKSKNAYKINDSTFYRQIDKIESLLDEAINFKLLLRYFKQGAHYDFLEMK